METKKEETKVVKKFEETTLDVVLSKVAKFQELGELRIPKDYSPANALRSAWLILTDHKDQPLAKCSKESVANSLLNMVVQGLSPMKKQCDFIVYGNKLSLQREYHGTIALARRYSEMKDVYAQIIYEGDIFEYAIDKSTGRKSIIKHEQEFKNIDNAKIKGAYAIVVFNDGTSNLEIMTKAQIQKAWEQGPMKGQSPAHKNFPDEMSKKTVINRACKLLISGSDDSILREEDDDSNLVRSVRDDIVEKENTEELNPEKQEVQTAEVVEETQPEKQEPEEVQKNGELPLDKKQGKPGF